MLWVFPMLELAVAMYCAGVAIFDVQSPPTFRVAMAIVGLCALVAAIFIARQIQKSP